MSVNAGVKVQQIYDGNPFWFELARGSSQRGFKLSKLSGVDCSAFLLTLNGKYIKICWL